MKDVVWIGSSKDDLSALPAPVKVSFGYRLRQVQQGKTPADMKPLPQFGTGVFELREAFGGNAFRAVYVVKLKKRRTRYDGYSGPHEQRQRICRSRLHRR
jgi:phage-related protein